MSQISDAIQTFVRFAYLMSNSFVIFLTQTCAVKQMNITFPEKERSVHLLTTYCSITNIDNTYVLLAVVVESFACLTAEETTANHLLKKRMRTIFCIACLVHKNVHDRKNYVKTD